MRRINRSELFMETAKLLALRSTCQRAQVGAVVVKDHRIVSTGYGGSPSGMPHCLDEGCTIGPDGGCISTIHAEANSIAFAARHGIFIDGCTMYVTLSPCLNCSKLIINSGIKAVCYLKEYRDVEPLKLLRKAGIDTICYDHLLSQLMD